tara:strand:- start:165 stop:344 length:180 start_codon:yes stop_codon:yes gene_type:complete
MTLIDQFNELPVNIRQRLESLFGSDIAKWLTPSITELGRQFEQEELVGKPFTKITGRIS